MLNFVGPMEPVELVGFVSVIDCTEDSTVNIKLKGWSLKLTQSQI